MARPSMRRKPAGANEAFSLAPYRPSDSSMRFYVPSVLESDYQNFLLTDVPGVNYTFEVVRNWYDRDTTEYKPEFIRASYFAIDWKSKIGNSDMGSNFYTNTTVDIKKGDIVIREDGEVYLLDWKVQRGPNVQKTQAKDCNVMLEIYRDIPAKVDSRGYVSEEARMECLVPPIPCVWTTHAGRPDYTISYNTPGLHADNLFDGWVQWNPITQLIQIGDTFVWGHESFRIVNLHLSEVDTDGEFGLLNLNARRVAGGVMDA